MNKFLAFALMIFSFSSFGQTTPEIAPTAILECHIDIYTYGSKIETLKINKTVKYNSLNHSAVQSTDKRFLFEVSGELGYPNSWMKPGLVVSVLDLVNRSSSTFQASNVKDGNSFRFEGGDLFNEGSDYLGMCSLVL